MNNVTAIVLIILGVLILINLWVVNNTLINIQNILLNWQIEWESEKEKTTFNPN